MSLPKVPKRIVVCCDGTWYAADQGLDSLPSNVAKMNSAIAKVGIDAAGNAVPQVVYYQGGVGTGPLGPLTKSWQAAFGTGLDTHVCEAYYFIASNYSPGDEIFLFGFSRGAFTARAVAGLICDVGILDARSLEFLTGMYAAYRGRGAEPLSQTAWAKAKLPGKEDKTMWEEFISHVQTDPGIKCVGVWDTVGSLGLPDTNVISKWWNSKYQFHDTKLHPKIQHAFHALALDERRGNFPPTMWFVDSNNTTTQLRQCWFPGYHGDVGGGTASGQLDQAEIDEVAFAWMVDQVSGLLQMDPDALNDFFLSRISPDLQLSTPPGPDAPPRRIVHRNTKTLEWGTGTITDTLSVAYFVAGGKYVRRPGETDLEYPGTAHTKVAPEQFREEIHPSVRYRIEKRTDYAPEPLAPSKGWAFNDGADGDGRRWIKASGGKDVLEIKEYVIPQIQTWDGIGSLERKLVPPALLQVLDKAAGLSKADETI